MAALIVLSRSQPSTPTWPATTTTTTTMMQLQSFTTPNKLKHKRTFSDTTHHRHGHHSHDPQPRRPAVLGLAVSLDGKASLDIDKRWGQGVGFEPTSPRTIVGQQSQVARCIAGLQSMSTSPSTSSKPEQEKNHRIVAPVPSRSAFSSSQSLTSTPPTPSVEQLLPPPSSSDGGEDEATATTSRRLQPAIRISTPPPPQSNALEQLTGSPDARELLHAYTLATPSPVRKKTRREDGVTPTILSIPSPPSTLLPFALSAAGNRAPAMSRSTTTTNSGSSTSRAGFQGGKLTFHLEEKGVPLPSPVGQPVVPYVPPPPPASSLQLLRPAAAASKNKHRRTSSATSSSSSSTKPRTAKSGSTRRTSPSPSLSTPTTIPSTLFPPGMTRSPSSLLDSLTTLLASPDLLPAGWLSTLSLLVEEGDSALEGRSRGPSQVHAYLLAAEEAERVGRRVQVGDGRPRERERERDERCKDPPPPRREGPTTSWKLTTASFHPVGVPEVVHPPYPRKAFTWVSETPGDLMVVEGEDEDDSDEDE
ncbi:hypothetical protein T439DRAFT_376309 [Meredithblackwellia eburnea MCA 4105]